MNDGVDRSSPGGAQESARQPMGIGTVVEVTLRILRRHWGVLLSIAILLVGPAALLTAATGLRFNAVVEGIIPGISNGQFDGSLSLTNAQIERLAGAFGVYLGATTVAGVLGTIAALGFSAVVGADYYRSRIDLKGALRVCLHRALSAFGVVVITTVIIVAVLGFGLALIVLALSILPVGAGGGGPGAFLALIVGVVVVVVVLYLTMRWAFALPVIAIEDQGWRRGLSRSRHLSGNNIWRTFVLALLAALMTLLLGALISQLLAIVLVDVLATTLGLDLAIAETLSVTLGTVVMAPLAAVLMAVLYFDLRVRRDPPQAITAPSPAAPMGS